MMPRRASLGLLVLVLAGCSRGSGPDENPGLLSEFAVFGANQGRAFADLARDDVYQARETAQESFGFFRTEVARAPGTWNETARYAAYTVERDALRTGDNAVDTAQFAANGVDHGGHALAADAAHLAYAAESDARRTAENATGAPQFVANELDRGGHALAADARYALEATERDARRTAENAAGAPQFVAKEIDRGGHALAADARYALEATERDLRRTAENAAGAPGFVAREIDRGGHALAADARYATDTARRDALQTGENAAWLAGYALVEAGEGTVKFVRRDLAGAGLAIYEDGRRGVENLGAAVEYALLAVEADARRTWAAARAIASRLRP